MAATRSSVRRLVRAGSVWAVRGCGQPPGNSIMRLPPDRFAGPPASLVAPGSGEPLRRPEQELRDSVGYVEPSAAQQEPDRQGGGGNRPYYRRKTEQTAARP